MYSITSAYELQFRSEKKKKHEKALLPLRSHKNRQSSHPTKKTQNNPNFLIVFPGTEFLRHSPARVYYRYGKSAGARARQYKSEAFRMARQGPAAKLSPSSDASKVSLADQRSRGPRVARTAHACRDSSWRARSLLLLCV